MLPQKAGEAAPRAQAASHPARSGKTTQNVRPKREDKRRSNVKTLQRARQDSNPRPAA
jgi:hypothetical protein